MLQRHRALLVHVVALSVLVMGAAAFTSLSRTVTLTVDGQATELRTFARTVGEALDRANVTVGERDAMAPGRETVLTSGQAIIVRTARPLVIDLDGRGPQVVWTTAMTVDDALASFGVRGEQSFVSVSRSLSIPRDGLAVQVRTPRPVTVLADGKRKSLVTTAPTLGDVLKESGVKVGKYDLVSRGLSEVPSPGVVLSVTRVTGRTSLKSVPVKFATVYKKDSSMFTGNRETVRIGRPGVLVEKYQLKLLDGKPAGLRLITKKYKVKPITRIIAVGTRDVPKASGGASTLNWAALAKCESGGRPRAVSRNGLYYGLYQFLPATWRAVGGKGSPIDASPAEQTYRAQRLYNVANWRTQWPVCGVNLFK